MGLAACGSKASEKPSVPPPPDPSVAPAHLGGDSLFIPGEYMAWQVKWKGFAGGRTHLVVGEPGTLEGKKAIIVRAETRGDGLIAVFRHLRDEVMTVVDLDQGAPIRSEGTVEEGRDVVQVEVEFGAGSYDLLLRKDGQEKRWKQVVPEGARAKDWLSALGFMRIWNPEPGTRGYFYAQSGRSFYRVEIAAAGVEEVRLELGLFECQRFEGAAHRLDKQGAPVPNAEPRLFSLWLTDDDRHLPVQILAETTFGDVYAELLEFEQPRDATRLRIKPSR